MNSARSPIAPSRKTAVNNLGHILAASMEFSLLAVHPHSANCQPLFSAKLSLALPRRCPTPPVKIARMKTKIMQVQIEVPDNAQVQLPINDALPIKAAEYWLKLGEADLALRELENLPTKIWKCSWALKTRIAAMGMLRLA